MMTTEDLIRPIIVGTYGAGSMPEALVSHLAEEIDAHDGVNREQMILITCWNWFSGGTTAESVAARIEEALRAKREGDVTATRPEE